MDAREQILLAMGWASPRHSRRFGVWWNPDCTKSIVFSNWHPADSVDDVRVVEEWLRAQDKSNHYFDALFGITRRALQNSDPLWMICATAAERWQACCKVLGIATD